MSDDAGWRSNGPLESVAGKWYLMDVAADEARIPHHRVDLIFHADADRLRGAILSRASGREIPLASVQFDGVVLRLQMMAPKDQDQSNMPFLVMHRTNGHFEGAWIPAGPTARDLKLVRDCR